MPGNMKIQMVEQHERSVYETPPHFSFAAAAFFFLFILVFVAVVCVSGVVCALSRLALSRCVCACAFSNLVCWLCVRVSELISLSTSTPSGSRFRSYFRSRSCCFDSLSTCWLGPAHLLARLLFCGAVEPKWRWRRWLSYRIRVVLLCVVPNAARVRSGLSFCVWIFEPLRSFVFVRVQHFVCCCCSITCFVRLISLEPEAFERGSRALVVALWLWLWHTHTLRDTRIHMCESCTKSKRVAASVFVRCLRRFLVASIGWCFEYNFEIGAVLFISCVCLRTIWRTGWVKTGQKSFLFLNNLRLNSWPIEGADSPN